MNVCTTHLSEILDDEEDVVTSEHEPVKIFLVVPVDVLPDGAALLPHVIPLLRPLVLNLEPDQSLNREKMLPNCGSRGARDLK